MTTVNHLATIQIPCPWPSCREGHVWSTAHEEQRRCATCQGKGTVDAWLVGPWDDAGCDTDVCTDNHGIGTHPPADLVALIDGRTAVEVVKTRTERSGPLDDCKRCHGYGTFWMSGGTKRRARVNDPDPGVDAQAQFDCNCTVTLGRGPIRPEHILPVVGWQAIWERRSCLELQTDRTARLWNAQAQGSKSIDISDLDLTPGQYAAIVTPEQP